MAVALVGILALILAFQLFFIAFFLFFHYRRTGGSSIFLGCCFLILGVNMLGILAQTVAAVSLPLFWHLFDDTLLLLLGPLLLFFTKSLAYRNFKIKPSAWYHLLPFLFFAILVIVFFNSAGSGGDRLFSAREETTILIARITLLLFYLHALIYIWYAKKILYSYNQILKEYYSNLNNDKKKALHLVLNTFLLLGLLGAIQMLLPGNFTDGLVRITGLVLILVLFVFVYRSIYQALKGAGWMKELLPVEPEKYSASTLGNNQREALAKRLAKAMVESELFLEPELTIGEVAAHLAISTKDLSQVINQTFGKNFFDYVNTYRIEKACDYLGTPDKSMTIQEVMYAVGFSSKSSFNTTFKKKTGKTPSEYRRHRRSGD